MVIAEQGCRHGLWLAAGLVAVLGAAGCWGGEGLAPQRPVAGHAGAPAAERTAGGRARPGSEESGAGGRLREPARALAATAPPCTGGTQVPNDQPYDAMFFRHYGVHPFVDTEDDRLSTFALDVDTASYTIARRYLQDGHLPPPEAVRVEEFVNAFAYDEPAPSGADFTLVADGAALATGQRRWLVRFGLHARQVAREHRPPALLVFVVDVSGSMAREDRLGAVKHALGTLLEQLRPDDRVGLVTYGSRGQVVLEPSADRAALRQAIQALQPGGATNAEEGLVLAYELARRHFRAGAIHRLILCSDGVANVGRTGADSILARVAKEARSGIELSTVGFGMGNYNDVLMEQLADKGDGNYAYVDTPEQARRVFAEQLEGMLVTVARDAKVQVEWNPEVVQSWRLLGYENRYLRDQDFRDERVDGGEVGAGHQVTALYEIKLRERPAGQRVAVLRLRYKTAADAAEVVELERKLSRSALAPSLAAAPRSLRLAAVAAGLAELLRESYWVRERDPEELLALAASLPGAFEGEPRVRELAELVQAAVRLRQQRSQPAVAEADPVPPVLR
ncbi:MAG: hypothetical protein KatS3mg102_2296 [Planctomycetota bacterium]|nr:MAG: hypothetical protein KatS3mg102_2296 [Planctomycetota bacterium]